MSLRILLEQHTDFIFQDVRNHEAQNHPIAVRGRLV